MAAAKTDDPALNRPLQGAGRRPDLRFMLSHPAHVIALGFGSGLAPVAPGTAGTLLAWVVYAGLLPEMNDGLRAALLGLSLAVAWWACTVTARHLAAADPSAIVIDEVVAFWLVLWLLLPATWLWQAVAFVLFRVFDAAKPGPVAWADQLWKGRARGRPIGWAQGFGIVLDDLVAALGVLVVIAIWRFAVGTAT